MIVSQEARRSIAANAIGFEMFHQDGRPVLTNDEGVEYIETTAEETERCMAAARRVIDHLDLAEL